MRKRSLTSWIFLPRLKAGNNENIGGNEMKTTRRRKNHGRPTPALASALVAMILAWAVAAQAQAVKGSGATNTIPVWTSSSTIGNSH
jgi:hypothetical protein